MSNVPPKPTWEDHYELTFWLWSSLADADAYLQASQILWTPNPSIPEKRVFNQNQVRRHQYHFIAGLGKLLRVLKRSQHIFPSIQPAYSRANHLIAEGKLLRDMVEHADDYQSGSGNEPDKFERESDLAENLPGSERGTVDAISTIIDDKGHWFGGRFNLETAVLEIKAIQIEALKLPIPD